MEDPLDVRRARAMMIEQLERAAVNGDTLLPASRVLEGVRSFELDPPCPLDHDQLLVYGDALEPAIHQSELPDGTKAFQLDRLRAVKAVVQRFVEPGRTPRGMRRRLTGGRASMTFSGEFKKTTVMRRTPESRRWRPWRSC